MWYISLIVIVLFCILINGIRNFRSGEVVEKYFTYKTFKIKYTIEKSVNQKYVITIHGGPGLALPFGVAFNGFFKTKNLFNLVSYDMAGTGCNYHAFLDNYEDILKTYEILVKEIMKIKDSEITIVALSYGTLIATDLALNTDLKISKLISIGQIVSSKKTIEYYKTLGRFNQYQIRKYYCSKINIIDILLFIRTLNYHAKKRGPSYTTILYMIFNFRYGLKNAFNNLFYQFKFRKHSNILKEFEDVNYLDKLKAINSNYYIYSGEHDILAPTIFLEEVNNSNINIEVVNDCSHYLDKKTWYKIFKSI